MSHTDGGTELSASVSRASAASEMSRSSVPASSANTGYVPKGPSDEQPAPVDAPVARTLLQAASVHGSQTAGPKRVIAVQNGTFHLTRADEKRLLDGRGCVRALSSPCRGKDTRDLLYLNNLIVSTRYTWLSFTPKFLFEQLAPWMKPANFYFLCIAVLESIQAVSTTQGRPSILVPLIFVLAVTGIKDLVEDRARGKIDKVKNDAVVKLYHEGDWKDVPARELRVGDMIQIQDNTRLPADVLVCGSGVPAGTHCFVDTKELDGESNLKPKTVPRTLLSNAQSLEALEKLQFSLRCDLPNGSMHEWNGDVTWGELDSNDKATGEPENLNLTNIIYADCVLRNTPWLIAMVVYTGEDTKIRQNMRAQLKNPRYKQTSMFHDISRVMLFMGILQIIICLICGILSAQFQHTHINHWYLLLEDGGSAAKTATLRFFTWFIICKDFVPISLYVTLEMVQFIQAAFVSWDMKMSHKMADGSLTYAKTQTSRLNEELAQVRYVFSDKTGTLTQNRMEFRKCCIGNVEFGTGTTSAGAIREARLRGDNVAKAMEMHNAKEKEMRMNAREHPNVFFDQEAELRTAALAHSTPEETALGTEVQEFLYALSLNNSIFPKTKKGGPEEKKDDLNGSVRIMDSSSPDETALCNFAQFAGFEVFARVGSRVTLRVDLPEPHFEEFEQVCCIDFNSKRKAMTVIVRKLEDNKPVGPLKIYTKGADTSIYALLAGGALKGMYEEKSHSDFKENPLWPEERVKGLYGRWSTMLARAVTYNEASLRSLMIARSDMDPEWWYGPQPGSDRSLREEFESLVRDQGPGEVGHVEGGCGPTCRLCVVERKVELGACLDLIGCTAIEDKLQDGVPDALKALMAAGINVWVLTGDNIATAINIGISCDLLDADMEQEGRLFRYDKLAPGNAAAKQAALRELITKNKEIIAQKTKDNPKNVYGACVHGDVWKQLSKDAELLTEFFSMTALCRSVIACRLEPKEKATIVESVRSRTKVTCLAIGDGNNDTPMIKAADIGVGIKGVEGTSAVAASDYALGQFRFLTRLLLVYGHYNYRGIAYLTKYIFYKCSMVVWTQIFFGVYSGFSGQFLFLDWAFQFHNVAYTALPIFALAIWDKDLSPELLETTPELYPKTRGKAFFSMRLYWGWMILGLAHAAISFYIPWYAYELSPSGFKDGISNSIWLSGVAVYTCLVIIANVRLCLIFTHWTWVHYATLAFSAFTYLLAMFIFDASSFWELAGVDYYATFRLLMSQPLFWVVCIITCLTAFSLDLTLEAYNRVFRPNIWHVQMEKERFQKRGMPKQVSSSRIDDAEAA